MPGRGSYGPGGRWIHDRAKRLLSKNDDMPKGMAYAVATQQAHKVGKSPKGFRTPEGVRTAKKKMIRPLKEYKKTANRKYWDIPESGGMTTAEKNTRTNKGKIIGGAGGFAAGAGLSLGAMRLLDKSGLLRNTPGVLQAAIGAGTMGAGLYGGIRAGSAIGKHYGRKSWQREDKELRSKAKQGAIEKVSMAAFYDELTKIAQPPEGSLLSNKNPRGPNFTGGAAAGGAGALGGGSLGGGGIDTVTTPKSSGMLGGGTGGNTGIPSGGTQKTLGIPNASPF